MPWPKPGLAATTGVLLDGRCDLVKLCGVLGVPGKDDVDLRIGGHGHDNAAIGVQAHHLRIARCADILGQPLPQHVAFGKRGA